MCSSDLVDELTYRMQALLYAGGRLGDRTIPPWTEGVEPFTIVTRAGFTGKYLPGEPLVQIPGALLGAPALSHVPLAALTLWAFHRSLKGNPAQIAATALLALSPMFVFTGATGLSHSTSLACVTLAALGLTLVREGRALPGAILTGLALGFGLLVRVQAVAPFGGVLGIWILVTLLRRRSWPALTALCATGALGVVAVLAYDVALTGDPLRLPWYLYRPLENMGFGEVFSEGASWVHTPAKALVNVVVTAVRMNGWWLGWPVSFLPLLLVRRDDLSAALPLVAAGLGLFTFNLFYYSTGVSDTGPVYSFELLLPLCALAGAALTRAAARWRWVAPAVAVHLLLGTGTFWLEHAWRLHRLVEAIHARPERALAALPAHSMLFTWPLPMEQSPGWVHTFPVRDREAGADVLTYPQMDDAWCRAVIAGHPDRACFYLGEGDVLVSCAEKWP